MNQKIPERKEMEDAVVSYILQADFEGTGNPEDFPETEMTEEDIRKLSYEDLEWYYIYWVMPSITEE